MEPLILIWGLIKNKLHSLIALLFFIISTFGIFASLDSLFNVWFNEFRFLIYSSIIILEIIWWLHFRYKLPRNKEKIGIIIALFCENEKERERLKRDFFEKITKNFRQEGLLEEFNMIFLKNHISEKIKNSANVKKYLQKINIKIKGSYFVWGEVKKRNNEEKYFFDLNGYVVHAPITKKTSRNISIDFSEVLPNKVQFLEKQQLEHFEIYADRVFLSIKYIVGIAALVSNDLFLAEKLHNNLHQEFNKLKPLTEPLKKIRDKVFNLNLDEKFLITSYFYNKKENSKEVLENIDFILKRKPKHYGV